MLATSGGLQISQSIPNAVQGFKMQLGMRFFLFSGFRKDGRNLLITFFSRN
jgi:hypothetical protein